MSDPDLPRRPFVPEDALRLRFVHEAGFIPGGSQGYYCVVAVDAARASDSLSLWLFDRNGGGRREITGRFANPRSPRPSADGARLAFVADVDGIAQLCSFAVDGGTVDVLTVLPQGVTGAPAWSPNGEAIVFTAPPEPRRDPSSPYRIDRPTIRFDGIGIVEDALQDLFLLDVGTRAVRRLTADRSINEDPRWSPDGRQILLRTSFPPDGEWTAKPSLRVVDVALGECRVVVGAWGGVLAAEWCPEGDRIVFCGVPHVPGLPAAYWHKRDIWTVGVAGGTPVCRTGSVVAGVGTFLEYDHPTWPTDYQPRIRLDPSGTAAYVTAQRGCDAGICRVSLVADEQVDFVVEPADRTCFLRDVDALDGGLLYVSSTLVDPAELFLRDGDAEHRVTELNDAVVHGVSRPDVVHLDVTAPDGLRIEGRALIPPGDGPFPTVLSVHGGPGESYGNVFVSDWNLLVGAGIAVVFSNFRGSGGYGDAFHHALQGKWGELGEQDHLATVDRAIEAGLADPERLGVYGLSHGGFATCWLAGRTRRFRAGLAENPFVNLTSLLATIDAPWWLPLALGAEHSEDPERYATGSALTYARDCTTPLLFIVGESDERCHPSEAEQYYRVLKRTGCPSEMLRLPNADHLGSWYGPVAARAAQNEALVEWFSRHLLAS